MDVCMPSDRMLGEFEFDFTVIRETEVWTCSTGDSDWQFLSNQADGEIGLLHDVSGGIDCRSNVRAILKCTDRDQYLQSSFQISNCTFVYLLCRAEHCHPEGNFFGQILSWAKSFPHGWHLACPICGTWRKPGPTALGAKVPAIQVFHTAAGVFMAHWPYVTSEAHIIALMKVFEMPRDKFDEIFHTDVRKQVWSIVRSHEFSSSLAAIANDVASMCCD